MVVAVVLAVSGSHPSAPAATSRLTSVTEPTGSPSPTFTHTVSPTPTVGTSKPIPRPTPSSPKPTASKPVVNLAAKLTTLPAGTSQVIIVHANKYATTRATFETFTKSGGVWKRQFASMAARIGSKGFSDHHLEYVPNTPVGVYGFGPTMYGLGDNPGVKYGYHDIVTDDWWNENPDSSAYNTFQHAGANPGGASEALWKITAAYQYFAFVKYNVPAIAGKGSGIFLHVATSGPTAGCVSLPKSDLIKVLTWLDPTKSPRIVLSPDSQLHRF